MVIFGQLPTHSFASADDRQAHLGLESVLVSKCMTALLGRRLGQSGKILAVRFPFKNHCNQQVPNFRPTSKQAGSLNTNFCLVFRERAKL